MLRRIALVGALATLVLVQPIAAAPREFTAAGKWKHESSGIKLPESIGTVRRDRMVEYDGPANIGASYQDTTTATTFTVYLYPSASGSIPVWFNEARRALTTNQGLGKTNMEGGIHSFVPPRRKVESGLIETLSVEQNGRSTGLAMFEANGHLIKLRATSSKLEPRNLELAMTAFLAGIAWPKPQQGNVKLQPVQDCPTAMAASEAPLAAASMVAVLISSSAAKVVADRAETPPIYCRDPTNAELNVYRPAGADNRYLMPLGDSGNALAVGRDEMMALMAKADAKNGEPGYWVQLFSANEIAGVEHFSSLPSPAQAADALGKSTPYYRVLSRRKQTEIAISSERMPAQ